MTTSHRSEVLTGALVLVLAIGFLVYGAQIVGIGGTDQSGYTASFRSAEGIATGTDVRIAGVKVGRVTDMVLDPVTYRAEAHLSVQGDIVLPDDTMAVISSEGLLGGNYVELLPGGSPFDLEPGAEITNTESAVSLVNLLLSFVSGGGDE